MNDAPCFTLVVVFCPVKKVHEPMAGKIVNIGDVHSGSGPPYVATLDAKTLSTTRNVLRCVRVLSTQ